MRPALLLVLAACFAPGCASSGTDGGVDVSHGNAIAQARLEEQVEEMRYMRGEELIRRMETLARRGDDAVPALEKGAASDDWLVRMGCMWILGAMGDRRNIPALQRGLADGVAEVRYQAASSLVKLGDGRGFRVLVDGLADGDIQNRFKCFEALRNATGRDFGYRHDAAPTDRRMSVGRWLEWLDSLGPSAL